MSAPTASTGTPTRYALERLESRPLVVLTHKRSGTHLTIDLFRRQFSECDSWKGLGENLSHLYLSLDGFVAPEPKPDLTDAKAIEILGRCARPLVKTHVAPAELPLGEITADGKVGRYWADWLEAQAEFLYVVRDGRDVLCSLQLLEARRDPRGLLPLSDFLRQEVEPGVSRVAFWGRHVEEGLARPGVTPLRFEELRDRPRPLLRRLAEELGLTFRDRQPMRPRRFRSVWRSRWARLFERRPESSAILGRPSGLRLHKWREAFTRADREFFHQEAGATLVRLGYEASDAWVDGDSGSAES